MIHLIIYFRSIYDFNTKRYIYIKHNELKLIINKVTLNVRNKIMATIYLSTDTNITYRTVINFNSTSHD